MSLQKLIFSIGCCFFGLAVLSYFRLYFAGTPNLDGLPMNFAWEIARRAIYFLLMLGAGLAFLKMMSLEIDEDRLPMLLRYSVALQLISSLALPFTSNDIFSNLAFGKMSILGLDPNQFGAAALPVDDPFRQMVTARWMDMPMVYGPVIGWLNRLVIYPGSLWASIASYKVVALGLSVIISVMVYCYCRRYSSGAGRCRSFILLAINPVFLWELSSQAHNDSVMVIGMLGFIILASDNRAWGALACLVFAVVTKFAALPALGFYFCHTFFKSKIRFLWFFLVLVVGGLFFVYYFSAKLGIVMVVPAVQGIDSSRLTNSPLFLIYKYLQPLGAHLQSLGYRIYWIAAMFFMAVIGIRFAWRSRTLLQVFLFTLLFTFLFNLIASPSYQPWYVIWLLPFAVAVKDNELQRLIAIYSVISMAQYAIQNSLTGSIINLVILGLFWLLYWRKNSPLTS